MTKKLKIIIVIVVIVILVICLSFYIKNSPNQGYSKMTPVELCNQLSIDSIRCKAIVTQDYKICESASNDLGERNTCCSSVALLKHDNSFCNQCIGASDAESNKYCMAFGSTTPQQITDIRNTLINPPISTNTIESCNQVMSDNQCYGSCEVMKNGCASTLAYIKNDPSVCGESGVDKDLCLRMFAEAKHDISICGLISFGSSQSNMCIEDIITNNQDMIEHDLFPHGIWLNK